MKEGFASVGPPAFLKLLAHDLRWRLLEILAASDRRVQELVALLNRPQNLISYHLRQLRDAGLVHERRSSYDGRDVYYRLDLERLQTFYGAAGAALHPALCQPAHEVRHNGGCGGGGGDPQRARVLFLCTHNSARSQMAEGILRSLGGDRVEVFSAGSEPGHVHPLAVRAMASMNIDIGDQKSKHMNLFTGQPFDYIITVCDRVREACPIFPNDPEKIHWSFADPAAVEGAEKDRYQAFATTARELMTRISYLLLMIKRQQE
jgi:protein-tyrosine-phosphatase/DNA-binding transcriptional ArsR family regulator